MDRKSLIPSSRVDLGEDVHRAFYEDLIATDANVQIIILENKDPDEDLQQKMNYQHFSGNEAVGRYGFYPVLEMEES